MRGAGEPEHNPEAPFAPSYQASTSYLTSPTQPLIDLGVNENLLTIFFDPMDKHVEAGTLNRPA